MTTSKKVPNVFPKIPHPTFRLAIIGDAVSHDDTIMGAPFIGAAGQLLRRSLGALKLSTEQCFLGHILRTDSDPTYLDFHGSEVQDGLGELRSDLYRFKPNCTLLLGRLPFRAFCETYGSTDAKGVRTYSLDNFRGSILQSVSEGLLPQEHQKVVATYHPSSILKVYKDIAYFRFDLAKAVRQSAFKDYILPSRHIVIWPTISQVEEYIQSVIDNRLDTGFDVEGWNDNVGITCFSVAKTPTDCLVIPIYLNGGKNYWTEEEEVRMWAITAHWLTDPNCGKLVTNATYEQFILAWKHNICIVNITEDTMLKQWECFCEIEKGLAVQASIWTDEPYYKHERHSESNDGKLLYNGKDSCITIESNAAQDKALVQHPAAYQHYRFNISLLPPMQYMMLRGCNFDVQRAAEHVRETEIKLTEIQEKLDAVLVPSAEAAGVLTRKRKSDPWAFNLKSVPQKKWLLYDFLGYKPYKKYGTEQLSTNEETLLRYYARERDPLLKRVIDGIQHRTRISDIAKLSINADGRLRCNYNLVGTDTGRLSSSASNALEAEFSKTGILDWESSGTNLQNVTKELRDCAIPDSPDFAFWNCDLSGADGWTVSADLAALGNTTMLDDYLAGIKPAKVLLLLLDAYERKEDPTLINKLDRSTLRTLTKALKFPDHRDEHGRPGDWKYLCMKRVQHGSNYDMQPDKLAATIFKDSDGLIDLTAKEAGIYQYLYKLRYNPKTRIDWITRELGEKGFIQTASGIRRKFFAVRSRVPDPDVVRAALAFEPQANTTYATNLALRNLWYDPKNRTSKGSLFIEPLLQVHDAISGQFKKSYADWAVGRIRSYFDTELIIHGIKVKIPFEGGYGHNWKDCHDVEFS